MADSTQGLFTKPAQVVVAMIVTLSGLIVALVGAGAFVQTWIDGRAELKVAPVRDALKEHTAAADLRFAEVKSSQSELVKQLDDRLGKIEEAVGGTQRDVAEIKGALGLPAGPGARPVRFLAPPSPRP